MPPSVLVLGAGIQGVCAALALSRKGFVVTLVDAAAECMTRASLHNEGKIHLGLVYANDRSERTSNLMMHAALRFAPLVEGLCGRELEWAALRARPFTYLVLDDSMLSPHEIESAYTRLEERYREEIQAPELHYLGLRPDRLFRVSQSSRAEELMNPGRVQSVIETMETPLAVSRFRPILVSALEARDGVERLMRHRVDAVERTASGFRVTGQEPDGSAWKREADVVVNCLWEGRLKLDEQMGLLPSRPWVYRLKLRVFADLPSPLASLPSLTMVLGPYGDIVVDPPGPAYLSWYPASLRGWSGGVAPPAHWESLSGSGATLKNRESIAREIIEGFESIVPGIGAAEPLDLAGGVIFSWGKTDIDDPESELHARHEIGVESFDGYFTINTGKFTTAPFFAEELVRMLEGAPSSV